MSLIKFSLGGNNSYMKSLFPPREGLASDIPAGDGNIEKLFYGVRQLYARVNYVPQSETKNLATGTCRLQILTHRDGYAGEEEVQLVPPLTPRLAILLLLLTDLR
jgi:hypothetical protein